MSDRTFESASIARRMLEEEFDRNVPSRTSGLFTWIGIGGLFGSVFVVCGGIGALLGGRELLLRQDAAAAEAQVVEDVRLETPAPARAEPPAAPATQGAPPPPVDDDDDGGNQAPTAPPENDDEARVAPAPAPATRPVRRRPPPAPPPKPTPDELGVETDDLIDPWGDDQ